MSMFDGADFTDVAVVWLYSSNVRGVDGSKWNTDAVVVSSSDRRRICWADYHCGVILCNDASAPDAELGLAFVRLPGIETWRGNHRRPYVYRTVSVTRSGELKFVDVDDGRFRSTPRAGGGCRITSWTLRTPELEWEQDAALRLEEALWALPSYQDSPLPRIVPTYPVLSMQDDNVVHFIVKGPESSDKCWMIVVDMKNKSLGPYMMYKNLVELDCDGENLSN
ncbi:hypothetical protein E2562_030808 [Oryza meyeriana var. granulata]|uniref:DUF1618 domain-containing protein n=1 Tax=Oryza meyeriana var. granulata TaxID=110450 RepID=A0A6G1DA98_9ORYZ|nr:hypothetical protein E2562_030808 [Oryza meyeriana var. granulata]